MKVTVLQHVPFEGPGAIEAWAKGKGASVDVIHLYKGDRLPLIEKVDLVAVMGGPMSVHDDRQYKWMKKEKYWLSSIMGLNVPVLGICLGAQLIAECLGGKVVTGPEKEIGWFPVKNEVFGQADVAFEWPESFVPLHWHGEQVIPPVTARILAASPACPVQAFCWRRNALGLQFHLESTPETVAALVKNAAGDITGGTYQQSGPEINAQAAENCEIVNPLLFRALDYLYTQMRF